MSFSDHILKTYQSVEVGELFRIREIDKITVSSVSIFVCFGSMIAQAGKGFIRLRQKNNLRFYALIIVKQV